jgi:DNA-binding response OmpR family regulator
MSGLESIKMLREQNYENPIILTTGSQSSKKDFTPEDISVDKIMIKPYDFEQLLIEVKSLLN